MSGLQGEFEGKVKGHNRDATAPDNQAAVQTLGFASHGIVIRTATGDIVFKEPDHQVDMEHVRKAIRERLGVEPGQPAGT